MTIRDAALEAQKTGRGIARKSNGERPMIIIPTNTPNCCIITDYAARERNLVPRWEPTLDDITATDWYVIG